MSAEPREAHLAGVASPRPRRRGRPPLNPDGEANGPAETTPQRLLRVSAELFAERGFDATGVQELSDASGLARGALYYHMKSKQDLLHSIAAGLLDEVNERARRLAAQDAPVVDRMRLLARDLLRDLATRRAAWTVVQRDWRALDPPRRQEVADLRDEYEAIWQRLFDEGADQGVLEPVDPILRRGIMGLFNSSYLWIDDRGEVPTDEIADRLLRLLLHGLARE
ncbi:TetR/AcrR family transcriptional regulator [Thermopolyspora sp. NPDC052614]|uniref:TetR/AcrR family transcriptional regulator n=1 Tax=Thermopolyspora sp. NPDC052614 TaxID=3155682 RepID=UPI00344823BF